MKYKYYVYQAQLGDEIVYIGKGVGDRYKHLKSGTSHVYEANEAYFLGKDFTVSILEHYETSEEAFGREMELISKIQPKWNVVMIRNTERAGYFGVHFEKYATNQWRCRFKYAGVQISNGYYPTEFDAAKAHDAYVLENGLSRALNFPTKTEK